jgi:hypothetical protein
MAGSPAARAQHPDDPLVQVDVVQGHADALGPPHPGVDQQQDDGSVAAAGEVVPLAGPEQPGHVLRLDYVLKRAPEAPVEDQEVAPWQLAVRRRRLHHDIVPLI